MKNLALILALVALAGCSSTSVDTLCVRIQRVSASPNLKAAFKSWCSGKFTNECRDFDTFIKTINKNNRNYEQACGSLAATMVSDPNRYLLPK